jgi:ubiquinone/menaquinone biosynthesis C-methylase UbiE
VIEKSLNVSVSTLSRRFVELNVRSSRSTERILRLPTDKTLWRQFEQGAADNIDALPDGAKVLDLGGGRRCIYARAVQPAGRLTLIAVDISPEELAANRDVDECVTADIAKEIPLASASVDLVLSRALLEHVDGVPASIREMARVLKPGGMAMHLVPCRYSLFGMAARVLPFEKLLWLTHKVMPWTRGEVEFPVRYDRCWPQALEEEFRGAGFARVETHITWAQPGYFEAVFPLFLLQAAYEIVLRKLRLRKLASYAIVKAVR